ncbi:sulfatase-like hydrolase/transferase [Ensifer sp. 4252]|uniref:sulfatase-like hydrolase/transferase n=1 Tax=Ensifer sp. 4252 TaxID=3373915 RepID=UPI003D220865
MKNVIEKAGRVLRHPLPISLAFLALLQALHYFDTRWRFVPFLVAVTLAIAALLFLLSRRAVFSLWAAGMTVLLIAAMSEVKFRLKGFSLHVFDFAFTGLDRSALFFLVGSYFHLLIAGLAVLVAAFVFLAVAFRSDRRSARSFVVRACLFVVAAVGVVALYPQKKDEPDYVHYISGYDASSFFVSIGDLEFPLGRIVLAGRLENVEAKGKLGDDVSCGAAASQPDLFVVLSESQTSPSYFPEVTVPEWMSSSFQSQDGRVHPMQVETFGGGTWVTNFSVMTGLSGADFGWQSPYVTQILEGRVKASLPSLMARCGYRTVAVLPMQASFVNEGPFLTSIGFQEIVDFDAMKPASHFVRDRFYFGVVERIVREHREKDPRPLFIAMQTLFPHGPYDMSLVPKDALPEKAFAPDAQADEYLRRVALAKQDLQDFRRERERTPGPNGTIVLDFGDHQAVATKDYLAAGTPGSNVFADLRSIAYKTYYTVHAYGRDLDMRPFAIPLDVGFLAASLIEAAGLPTSPTFEALARLRDACGGRYHTCPDRALVDQHLRQRQDAGLLDLD